MGKAFLKETKARLTKKCAELQARGWTYMRMGEELGISAGKAFQLISEKRAGAHQETLDQIRMLREEKKMSYAEIAKAIGLGATTIRSLLMKDNEEREKKLQTEIYARSGKKGAMARWGKGEEVKRKHVLKMRQSLKRTIEKSRKVIEPEKVEAQGPLRAVGYLRVSTEEQAKKGMSLDTQEEKVRFFIDAKEWELIECVKDPGFSGKNIKRPGLQRIIEMCRSNGVDIIVVYKLDRLSRRIRDMFELVEDVFKKNDVKLASVTETIDTSTAMGGAFFGIITVLAQLERERIGERVRDARTFRDERGEWTGRLPYGYELAYDEKGNRVKGKLIAVESKLKHYTKAKEMYATGYSQKAVANKFGFKSQRGATFLINTDLKVLKKRMRKYLYKPIKV